MLSNDNSTCLRSCELNQFPWVAFNANTLVEEKIFCKTCDKSCASCVGEGTEHCTSCGVGSILSLKGQNGAKAFRGSCLPKPKALPSSSSSLHQIQVMNALNSRGIGAFAADGGRLQPNFMAAYFHAFKLASKQSGVKVEILLETGSHYITPAHIEAFHSSLDKNREVDMDNAQFSLSILPLTCAEKDKMGLRYQSTNCKDPALYAYNVVSLFNKAGASFSIRVPTSLRFVGI